MTSLKVNSKVKKKSVGSKPRPKQRVPEGHSTGSVLSPNNAAFQVSGRSSSISCTDAPAAVKAAVVGAPRKSRKSGAGTGRRSKGAKYIGISQYRMKKWEAHVWAKGGTPEGGEKGRQLHLGYFNTALLAARTYDRAALFLRGERASLNMPAEEYEDDFIMRELRESHREDFLTRLRELSSQLEEMEGKAAPCKATGGGPKTSAPAVTVPGISSQGDKGSGSKSGGKNGSATRGDKGAKPSSKKSAKRSKDLKVANAQSQQQLLLQDTNMTAAAFAFNPVGGASFEFVPQYYAPPLQTPFLGDPLMSYSSLEVPTALEGFQHQQQLQGGLGSYRSLSASGGSSGALSNSLATGGLGGLKSRQSTDLSCETHLNHQRIPEIGDYWKDQNSSANSKPITTAKTTGKTSQDPLGVVKKEGTCNVFPWRKEDLQPPMHEASAAASHVQPAYLDTYMGGNDFKTFFCPSSALDVLATGHSLAVMDDVDGSSADVCSVDTGSIFLHTEAAPTASAAGGGAYGAAGSLSGKSQSPDPQCGLCDLSHMTTQTTHELVSGGLSHATTGAATTYDTASGELQHIDISTLL